MSAEFDAYADGYEAGMDNSVKRLLGEAADDFIAVKLRWMLRRFPDMRAAGASFRIIDYGCGAGALLRVMRQAGLRATLVGCDVSQEMLDEATRCWPHDLEMPEFRLLTGPAVPGPPADFDLVVISAVLHHIAPADRPDTYAALHRALRPGGQVIVFEHNPLNPVTRYVVSHTPIDRNAVLLSAGEAAHSLRAAGFARIRTDYIMFFPPRLRVLSEHESLLRWLPLGGQYATTGLHP